MAQTKKEMQALLAGAGFHPLKRYGQHFLIDGNLLRKLVAAAGVTRWDAVLEVGPGTGTLTEELLGVAGHVVAVEIDRGLAELCQGRFRDSPRFTLIHRDVLERKGKVAPEVLAELERRREELAEVAARAAETSPELPGKAGKEGRGRGGGRRARAEPSPSRGGRGGQDTHLPGRAMLVANLPYQVATPLIVDLLMGEERVSPLCFTVQREVAERLAAPPGGKDYGPISVLAQALGTIERIARVPPEAFWPAPQVESAMLRIDAREADGPEPRVKSELARLVHGCFNHRRKTLRHNLRGLLERDGYQQVEASGQWRLDDRPERLSVEQWVELARFVSH